MQKRIYFIGDSRVYSATKEQAIEFLNVVINDKNADWNEWLTKMKILNCDAPNVGEGRFGKMFFAYWICNLDQYESKTAINEINQSFNKKGA